jgi:MSHA biogenesis protein MshL
LFDKVFGAEGDNKDLTDVAINPVTGTIVVLATDKQHALIQEFLSGVGNSSQRQVLIEATIVEVQLTNAYQAGIDWARVTRAAGDGFSIRQQLAPVINPEALTVAYSNNPNTPTVSATLKLLEQFGNTKVLSSPKLMAINNQTALLKVVDNIVYFTFEREVSAANSNQPRTETITSIINTVAVGVSMSMTPQINENGVITLNVRPTISRVLRFREDPVLRLISQGSNVPLSNLIPEITVREMESVLQLSSGQTAILGGLMQDNIRRDKSGVPGLTRIPNVGDVFSQRDEAVSKSELVIFLRPTVVTNPSLDSDELKYFRRFIPEVERTGSRP